MTKYVVTAVDYGETCDGKARVLKICDDKEVAKKFVTEDITWWAAERKSMGVQTDYAKMCAWYDYNEDERCEWNISEIEA